MAVKGSQRVGQFGINLIVKDVEAAARFYAEVLGAEEICRHYAPEIDDPPWPHAISVEMRLSNAYLRVSMENPRWQEAPRPDWPRSPQSASAPSAIMHLYVDDVDAVLTKALAAGATPRTDRTTPEDTYWGDRIAQFHDPAGHVWRIQTCVEEVAIDELPARYRAARAAYRAAKQARA
jgi:PhnB protein